MTLMELVDKVIERLEESGINVVYEDRMIYPDVKDIINKLRFISVWSPVCRIYVSTKQPFMASFHVATKPEVVANIMALLQEFTDKIEVGDSYYFSNNMLESGETAYKLFYEDLANNAIENLNNQLEFLEILRNTERGQLFEC